MPSHIHRRGFPKADELPTTAHARPIGFTTGTRHTIVNSVSNVLVVLPIGFTLWSSFVCFRIRTSDYLTGENGFDSRLHLGQGHARVGGAVQDIGQYRHQDGRDLRPMPTIRNEAAPGEGFEENRPSTRLTMRLPFRFPGMEVPPVTLAVSADLLTTSPRERCSSSTASFLPGRQMGTSPDGEIRVAPD